MKFRRKRKVAHADYTDLFDRYVSTQHDLGKVESELNETRGFLGLILYTLTNGNGEFTFENDREPLPPVEIKVTEGKETITFAMRPKS